MSNGIAGKVVVITGGSSGIGEETARHLAGAGAKVALAARRKDRLQKVVDSIQAAGSEARSYVVDVTRKANVADFIAQVEREFGRVDVLISNAGVMPIAPLAEVRTDEWDQMIDVNVRGLLYGVAAVLPIFVKQGSGHFINMGSVAGFKVFAPGGSVYSATKYAVHAISEGLRAESGGKYRVTTLAPGAVESELKYSTNSSTTKQGVIDLYERWAIPAGAVAAGIAYAISQPDNVSINEVVVRPTVQDF